MRNVGVIQVTIANKLYNVHVVNKQNYDQYKKQFENTNICNPEVISDFYELLSYASLEVDGYIGFFLMDTENTTLYSSLVVDLTGENNMAKIVLLCSNTAERIPNRTRLFFTDIIRKVLPRLKPGITEVVLSVAQAGENKQAIQFYTQCGFHTVIDEPNLLLMKYSYAMPPPSLKTKVVEGGWKKKTKKKRKSIRC